MSVKKRILLGQFNSRGENGYISYTGSLEDTKTLMSQFLKEDIPIYEDAGYIAISIEPIIVAYATNIEIVDTGSSIDGLEHNILDVYADIQFINDWYAIFDRPVKYGIATTGFVDIENEDVFTISSISYTTIKLVNTTNVHPDFDEERIMFKTALLKKEPWTLITHDKCNDGTMSAMIAGKFASDNDIEYPEIIFASYTTELEDLDIHTKNVMLADISFPVATLEAIREVSNTMVLVDHHEVKEGENDITKLPYCKVDLTKSGCLLAWELFNSSSGIVPLMTYLVGRRDSLWDFHHVLTRAVNSYMSGTDRVSIIENAEHCLSLDYDGLRSLLEYEQSIIKYQDNHVKQKLEDEELIKTVNISGFTVPCLNNTHLHSEIGNAFAEKHLFSLQYVIQKDRIKFSLRSKRKDKFNCAVLARRFGGNGHANAAGFSISLDKFDMYRFFVMNEIASGTEYDSHYYADMIPRQPELLEGAIPMEHYELADSKEMAVTASIDKELNITLCIISNDRSLAIPLTDISEINIPDYH